MAAWAPPLVGLLAAGPDRETWLSPPAGGIGEQTDGPWRVRWERAGGATLLEAAWTAAEAPRHAELRLPPPDAPRGPVLNGWQSWSETRRWGWDAPPRRLRAPARPWLGAAAGPRTDAWSSWSWMTWPSAEGHTRLVGSLDEGRAFTRLRCAGPGRPLVVTREEAPGRAPRFRLFWTEGSETEVRADWAAARAAWPEEGATRRPGPRATGYTSWYRHYTRITPALLEADLEGVARWQPGARFFQVDDGWQAAVGEWDRFAPAFAGGTAGLAARIRDAGLEPGIWLAPWVAERRSRVLREHPEWLQRDARGRPLAAGWTPLWSGRFYALDPDHPGLRAHLEQVLDRLFQEGFALVKLDFLYAACLRPARVDGVWRSAAERLALGLEHLGAVADRHAATDGRARYLLGCGVPLGPAMGRVDYARTGPDVHLSWEHRPLAWLRHRERVSTASALRTVLSRHGLPGFTADPDVAVWREGTGLDARERHAWAEVQAATGGLRFHSEDLAALPPEVRAAAAGPAEPLSIDALEERDGHWTVEGLRPKAGTPGRRERLCVNASARPWSCPGPGEGWTRHEGPEPLAATAGGGVLLPPHAACRWSRPA